MPKNIRQQIQLKATPQAVYEAIVDSKLHTQFTGAKAKISETIGEAFKAADGFIEGINVELVPGKRIVQAWRGKDWPKGTWSIATFDLEQLPGGKTLLTFRQSGVPNDFAKSIRDGWHKYYWKPMRSWFHELESAGRDAVDRVQKATEKAAKTVGKRPKKKAKKAKAKAKKKSKAKKTAKKKTKKAASKKKTAKKAPKKAAKKKTKKAASKKKAAKKGAKKAAKKKK